MAAFPQRLQSLLLTFAGTLLPLSLAPFHYYPLALVSLVLLFNGLRQTKTPLQTAVVATLFGLGMFGLGVYWVFIALAKFGDLGWILSGLMTAIFVSFLASVLGFVFWFAHRLIRRSWTSHDLLWLFPVTWFGFEWFKTWFLTGFPWLEVGAGQIDGPLASYIPLVGTQGVSLLVALCAAWIVHSFVARKWQWAIPVIALWAGGFALQPFLWTQPVSAPLSVSAIQGSVPQSLHWDAEQAGKTMRLYREMTQQNWDSDLIVWPENALPVAYHQANAQFLAPLQKEAQATNTTLLIGMPYEDPATKAYYNSVALLGDKTSFYRKQRTVPFGEFTPFASGLNAIGLSVPLGFSRGEKHQPLLTVSGHPIGVSICYDDVYSDTIVASLPAAHFLVNATNNGWYGNSSAPAQHLQIARNRALETGREIVRSTTSGISALIDSKGNITTQTPAFEPAVLRGTIQPRTGSTPYVRSHGWAGRALAVLCLLLWFVIARRKV